MKCPYCGVEVEIDQNGDCAVCHRNLVSVNCDLGNELQFYCAVCDDFFNSPPDGTGYDQAPCPACGDLSCTTDFHAGEMNRSRESTMVGLYWMIYIVVILLTSGVGWANFSSFL